MLPVGPARRPPAVRSRQRLRPIRANGAPCCDVVALHEWQKSRTVLVVPDARGPALGPLPGVEAGGGSPAPPPGQGGKGGGRLGGGKGGGGRGPPAPADSGAAACAFRRGGPALPRRCRPASPAAPPGARGSAARRGPDDA